MKHIIILLALVFSMAGVNAQESDKQAFYDNHNALSEQQQAQALQDTLTIANQGDADAQYRLGLMYGSKSPYGYSENSVNWIKKSAEQDHTGAQTELANIYMFSLMFVATPENSAEIARLAFYWLEKSANKGDVSSQFQLVALYLGVKGVELIPVDHAKARFWLEKLATHSDVEVQTGAKEVLKMWAESPSPSEFTLLDK